MVFFSKERDYDRKLVASQGNKFFRLKTFGTNINNSRFLTGWILNAYLLCVFITSIY